MAAHTLKSSAAYLGGTRLSRCCAEVEAPCRQERSADTASRAQQLCLQAEVAFAGLVEALTALPVT